MVKSQVSSTTQNSQHIA